MSISHYLAPALLVPSLALAGVGMDQAKVVDVEPVYRTVSYTVPTEQCRLIEEPVYEPRRRAQRNYTAPIIGAIIGGAIGNAVGHNKTNKKVGTAVGAVLGGSIGHGIGRDRAARNERDYRSQNVSYETREVCETVHETHEKRELDGYEVTYRYAGMTHTTRMDRDPGRYLDVRVRVTPV